ncbi:MAG: LysR family transcriptional regulator [Planctomycetota bacterium]|jgi:DNA-binding transcriptional LysR family regulator
MIQLHRLEGFYWVGRTGGYAKAARAFPYPITQPAVHQQVKKLEAELDLSLFERVGKEQMQLTPAGAHLYQFVAPFFEQLASVLRAVRSGEHGGQLHIQAEAMLLRHLMPAWVKRMQRKHKGIQVELRELMMATVEPLRLGHADIVVAHLPVIPDDIATMRIATLWPFVVIPRDHLLARRQRFALSDLAGEPFIAYHEGLLSRELQLQALRDHGVTPSEIISASSAETILGFVESGLGYSLVPSFHKSGPTGRGIAARPLTTPKVEFPIYAAWRKDTPENSLLDAALECAPS